MSLLLAPLERPSMRVAFRFILLLVGFSPLRTLATAADLATQIRRPVDAIWFVPGEVVLTANSRAGSVSLVDVQTQTVVHEGAIGGQPTGVLLVTADRVAVIDRDKNQLRLLRVERNPWSVSVEGQLPVLRGPTSIQCLTNHENDSTTPASCVLSVSSQWDRSIEKITLDLSSRPIAETHRQRLPLPFAPREQLVLPGGEKLLVADNHAGQLALVDISRWTLDAIRPLNAHNIRGLVMNPTGDSVLISHQILNQQVATGLDAVRDGTLLQNVVRIVPLNKLYDSQALLPVQTQTIFLGRAGEGAADPGDIVWDAQHQLCVSLSGVQELAILTPEGHERSRPAVGRRPTKLLPCSDRTEVITINTFGDSLSVVETSTGTVKCEISLGPQPILNKPDRGELLFHDARLSLDRWMSCHSCHTDGHANGMLADTRGDGTFGTPKRVLSLLGGRDANPWGWTGEVRILHEQVTKSVRNTMHGEQLPMQDVIDVVAYMHTLEPAPPRLPATDDPNDMALLGRGTRVFESAGCVRCHIPPLTYTSDATYDVGIHDETGRKLFNPPSLRGVSQRDSLFHDARARTLEDVLDQGHFLQSPLTPEDQSALLRFLKSL